jgi:acetylornithine deacetylase
MSSLENIRNLVKEHDARHIQRLGTALKASYGDLDAFQDWIKAEMQAIGMEVSEFKVDVSELKNQPGYQKTLRDNPQALLKAKNVVGKIAGHEPRQGMLLFGHADKRPETYEWAKLHPEMTEIDDRFYGPGIADDVSGITAMLSAVETYCQLKLKPRGDLFVASILGKQGGIFGTNGLMKRYGPLDAAIYVHPAESGDGLGELKIASLGSLEFIINLDGKGPDSTEPIEAVFSKSAISATDLGIFLLNGLQKWAAEQEQRYPHERLQALSGQTFSLLAGRFTSGTQNEVYQVARNCIIQGIVCFPPNARLETVRAEFVKAFETIVQQDPWLSQGHARLEWGDTIDQGCQSDENHPFMQMASQVIRELTGKTPSMYYGHTVSDIRYPLLYWKAQAFSLGPLAGNLAKENEWVDRKEYLDSIVAVTEILKNAA